MRSSSAILIVCSGNEVLLRATFLGHSVGAGCNEILLSCCNRREINIVVEVHGGTATLRVVRDGGITLYACRVAVSILETWCDAEVEGIIKDLVEINIGESCFGRGRTWSGLPPSLEKRIIIMCTSASSRRHGRSSMMQISSNFRGQNRPISGSTIYKPFFLKPIFSNDVRIPGGND